MFGIRPNHLFYAALFLSAAALLSALMIRSLSPAPCAGTVYGDFVSPSDTVDGLIERLGGLPKEPIGILELYNQAPPTPVFAVKEWSVGPPELASRNNSLIFDESRYVFSFDTNVTFQDGTSMVLRWQDARAGIVACPFVLSWAGGIPGTITPVSVNSR